MRISIVVSGLALLHGCDTAFDPSYLLNDLRVLAIRAEPPSVVAGDSTTLDALIYDPDNAEVEHQWSWCPLRGDSALHYECALTEDGFEEMVYPNYDDQVVTPIDFDLGTSPTALFELPAPVERIAALCASEELACPRGQLVFSVRLVAKTGAKEVTALSQVTLLLTPSSVTNANPSIDGVQIGDVAVDEALLPGVTYQVVADVPLTAAEPFTLELAEPADTTESLAISWFVEGGDLSASRTRYVPEETDFGAALFNTWTLPEEWELASDAMQLFIVIRDSRGGVDWAELSVELELP